MANSTLIWGVIRHFGGGGGRKPLGEQHLRTKVYALKTSAVFDILPKVGYNAHMKHGKISDCNGDTWHHEAQDSDGLTIWQAWRVTFNGHQKNLSWHCSEADAQAFIAAGIAQAQRSHDDKVALMRNDFEQAQADMAELRGPKGWV